MRSIESVIYDQKRYFRFKTAELLALLYTALGLGFVMTFRMWGTGDTPDLTLGLSNLLFYSAIILLILILRESTRKFFAINSGITAEYKFWSFGTVISIIVAVITAGVVPIYWAGNAHYDILEKQRLGRFRYGLTTIVRSIMGFASVAATMGIAILLKMIKVIFSINNPLLDRIILFTVLLSLICMLPLPRLDGLEIMLRARIIWATELGVLLALAFGVLFLNNLLTILLLGVAGGFLFFILWYIFQDRHYYGELGD